MQLRTIIGLSTTLIAATIGLTGVADAQFRYGPAPVRGPIFNYGYAPMVRQPVPYGNVVRGFQSLPMPVYRSWGQFYQSPNVYSAGRAVIYTCCYPRTAY